MSQTREIVAEVAEALMALQAEAAEDTLMSESPCLDGQVTLSRERVHRAFWSLVGALELLGVTVRTAGELRALVASLADATPGGAERVASLRPVQEIVREIVADVMADDEASADHGRRQP